jgi:hypothetical protein
MPPRLLYEREMDYAFTWIGRVIDAVDRSVERLWDSGSLTIDTDTMEWERILSRELGEAPETGWWAFLKRLED